MPLLPVGFFMPLPLPIMIPFMMWQSAAIAAGFGTYFQFAKRRVSAMSNEEFNKADPHELVNSMYADIVKSIPDSFAKVDSLTPVILQSMNVMLDQAVKWLQNVITGNITGTPSQPSLPSGGGDVTPDTTELLSLTIQFISTMNDLSLEATIRNLSDYNQHTCDLLLAEQARRIRTAEPAFEPPSLEQQTTKITPTFAASLSKADLEKGGHRHRTTASGVIHWNGTHRLNWDRTTVRTFTWNGTWTSIKAQKTASESIAISIVNTLKRSVGSAYVLEFKSSTGKFTWYLISDEN